MAPVAQVAIDQATVALLDRRVERLVDALAYRGLNLGLHGLADRALERLGNRFDLWAFGEGVRVAGLDLECEPVEHGVEPGLQNVRVVGLRSL